METISDYLSGIDDDNTDIVGSNVYPHAGFIAEDLEKAGLEEFVTRGEDNDLEGIEYSKLPVLHHQLLREAYDRIDYLETQLKLIKKKLGI